MLGAWFALKKSLTCKLLPSDSHEAIGSDNVDRIQRRMPKTSAYVGCLANLKYMVNGSMICKSKVEESRTENSEPVVRNERVLNNMRVSLRARCLEEVAGFEGHGRLRLSYDVERLLSEKLRKYGGGGSASSVCQICGEEHRRSIHIESHSLSKHAVTELVEGDSTRKIVEIICQTGQKDTVKNKKCTKIESIFKVNNIQNNLSQFEAYRETVKTKALKQPDNKENPRCLADGNELLRFYAATILCPFGKNGSSSLCRSINCGACRILRHGFFTKMDSLRRIGIFATSNSERALRYACGQQGKFKRKALFVCRVIAGKIQSPVRKLDQAGFFSVDSRFDSLAWKVGQNESVEELFLLNPRALLPCFVVIHSLK